MTTPEPEANQAARLPCCSAVFTSMVLVVAAVERLEFSKGFI
jgi:hypothetical protein